MPVDLATYQTLIPAHAAVSSSTVNAWLGIAVKRHDVASWGAVYDEAMIFYAAHFVEKFPSSGGAGSGSATGALTGQRDGDLSRSYAAPASSAMSASDAALATTEYGRAYLDFRNSRAATGPFLVGPSCP